MLLTILLLTVSRATDDSAMVAAAVAYASDIYHIMLFDKLGGFGFSVFAPETG